jgi:hypothetical protein
VTSNPDNAAGLGTSLGDRVGGTTQLDAAPDECAYASAAEVFARPQIHLNELAEKQSPLAN